MRDEPALLLPLSRRGLVLGAAGLLTGCNDQPSTLPNLALPAISGLKTNAGWPVPGIDTRVFAGRVTVLNVWASWCPYCRGEHGLLHEMARGGRYTLAGLVYQDTEDKARAYLLSAGNPYAAVSVDSKGQLSGMLGQRGVPHTYVIGRNLAVVTKFRGALSPEALEAEIMPAVARAQASA